MYCDREDDAYRGHRGHRREARKEVDAELLQEALGDEPCFVLLVRPVGAELHLDVFNQPRKPGEVRQDKAP